MTPTNAYEAAVIGATLYPQKSTDGYIETDNGMPDGKICRVCIYGAIAVGAGFNDPSLFFAGGDGFLKYPIRTFIPAFAWARIDTGDYRDEIYDHVDPERIDDRLVAMNDRTDLSVLQIAEKYKDELSAIPIEVIRNEAFSRDD